MSMATIGCCRCPVLWTLKALSPERTEVFFFSHQEAFGAIHIVDGFFQVGEKKWSILPEEVEITPVDLPVSKSDEDVTNGVYFALFVKCAEMVLVIFI